MAPYFATGSAAGCRQSNVFLGRHHLPPARRNAVQARSFADMLEQAGVLPGWVDPPLVTSRAEAPKGQHQNCRSIPGPHRLTFPLPAAIRASSSRRAAPAPAIIISHTFVSGSCRTAHCDAGSELESRA